MPVASSANDITFGLTGYTVEGGTLTLNGSTNIITSTVPAAANSAVNLTVSAALAGTNGFTKAGLGHVYLSGNNAGLSGTLTINTATGTQTSGVTLSGASASGGITQIDVNGGGVVADGSFLSLENTSLASGVTVNLTGQGGNGTLGTLRGRVGVTALDGPVNINSALVRISNYGGTSLTLNGPVTTNPAVNGCYIRFGQNQGVIFTNTSNNWSGVTNLGEGSVYFHPGTLPATSSLFIGSSNPGDFGTNGSFTSALGNAAGQVQFGRANDGQRAVGFSARGGELTVNLGGAAADLAFINAYGKSAATTNTSPTVTVTDATDLVVGMSVTGTGIPADTLVNAITGTTLTLSKNATATNATIALNFFAAADPTRFNSSVLVLNGVNADSPITLTNPLDLNGFARTIQVSANTATLAGGIKNSSATAASLRKTGAGSLPYDPGTSYTLTLAGMNAGGGTLELKSGTYTVTGSGGTAQPDGVNGFIVARGGTFRLSGATVNVTGGGYVIPAGNTGGGGNQFILDSGIFDGGTKEVLNAYGAGGTFTINGGLFVGGEFRISQSAPGVVNLNGGTLRVSTLKHSNNSETVNFNGGTLQASGARADFITASVDVANILAGGAIIDSNGFDITIPKILTEDSSSTGGGLTKIGDGALTITAANSYTGPTAVKHGSLIVNADYSAATGAVAVGDGIGDPGTAILGGTGPLAGNVAVGSDGVIAPGTAVGTLTASANVSGTGSLAMEISDDTADKLVVGGSLDITTLNLNLTATGTQTQAAYVLVDASSAITGTRFANVTGTIPPGYTLTYNYNDGIDSHNIALVGGALPDPFTSWVTTTHGLVGTAAAVAADPDNDDLDNAIEFVLGGQPNPANPNASSSALAPTTALDPANLVFTYRRTDLSLTQPGIQIAVEYGSNLTGWTPAVASPGGVTINVTENGFGAGVDKVEVLIPRSLAVGSKLFARLNVVIP